MGTDGKKTDKSWSFPELNRLAANAGAEATFQPWLAACKPVLTREELATQELFNKLEEVKQKELRLNQSIQYLENMFRKLKNPFSLIEADMIETINNIVKRMTHRLIQKELSADPSIITQVIEELKSNIPANDTIISINVSMVDYEFLREHSAMDNLYLPDPSLAPGDVVIRCNFSEVHAHVNTSIDNMMSIRHE